MDIQFRHDSRNVRRNRISHIPVYENVRPASRPSRRFYSNSVDGVGDTAVFYLHGYSHQGALLQRRQRDTSEISRQRHADFHSEIHFRVHKQFRNHNGDIVAVLHQLRRYSSEGRSFEQTP